MRESREVRTPKKQIKFGLLLRCQENTGKTNHRVIIKKSVSNANPFQGSTVV